MMLQQILGKQRWLVAHRVCAKDFPRVHIQLHNTPGERATSPYTAQIKPGTAEDGE